MYSIQHTPNRRSEETTNALLGFVDMKMSEQLSTDIKTNMDVPEVCSIKLDLDEFKYLGILMNLPVIIILNDHDENVLREHIHYDIYYHFKRRNDYDILHAK